MKKENGNKYWEERLSRFIIDPPNHLEGAQVREPYFDIQEWRGSGPGYLHDHHGDDEAWHVLESALTFKFKDREVEAPAGTTVFVPAGVAHDHYEAHGPTRYLIILTPRLSNLIAALHAAPFTEHAAIMRQRDSEIVE